jgi:mRNA-degrading endonuclease RelE of RelBE toxin-antitoxin system
MNLKIISLESFNRDLKKLFKKYKKITSDLKTLQSELLANPKAGIELGNGCYKIRLANSSIPTGKSGGFRVIYYYLDAQNNIYLMSIYSKTELSNISDEKLLEILNANGLT